MNLVSTIRTMGYSGGDPDTGESQRLAHLDVIPSYRPPSNLEKTHRVPADQPGEKSNEYFDNLRRRVARAIYLDQQERRKELTDRLSQFDYRMRNGMRERINKAGEVPGGAPGLPFDQGTALPAHQGVYQPFEGF